MKPEFLKRELDEEYRNSDPEAFIARDPIQVPRSYRKKEDIEIMGFLTATLSWGQRATIIRNARLIGRRMEEEPHRFLLEAEDETFQAFSDFQHRTFNGTDLQHFLRALQHIYREHGGLQQVFQEGVGRADRDLKGGIERFRSVFFSIPHEARTQKHVAALGKGSPAKRLNMFLRWMVRKDGIDIGIWNELGPHRLSCPLDLHSARTARTLGLLKRKQNDAKAVDELDRKLRELDPEDPVKYDIALHRMSAEASAA